jgi:hypothetical protein
MQRIPKNPPYTSSDYSRLELDCPGGHVTHEMGIRFHPIVCKDGNKQTGLQSYLAIDYIISQNVGDGVSLNKLL